MILPSRLMEQLYYRASIQRLLGLLWVTHVMHWTEHGLYVANDVLKTQRRGFVQR